MKQTQVEAMPFSRLIGMRLIDASPDRVLAELTVMPELCTTNRILHGGAIMAFADSLGAIGAFAALPPGAGGTTTIESKTNFLSGAPEGSIISGEARPVKIGRRVSVWQTMIRAADGREIALTTQTQLVLT